MTTLALLQVTVYGRVQGVYFRAFITSHAQVLGLTGYVRNLDDRQAVEVRLKAKMINWTS